MIIRPGQMEFSEYRTFIIGLFQQFGRRDVTGRHLRIHQNLGTER
jgi:hypothetical protein